MNNENNQNSELVQGNNLNQSLNINPVNNETVNQDTTLVQNQNVNIPNPSQPMQEINPQLENIPKKKI